MVAMVEAIHKFKARVAPLVRDDAQYVLNIASWWLLAKNMQPRFKTGNCYLGSNIIGQANQQCIKVFRQQPLIIMEITNSIGEDSFAIECLIAHSYHA